MGMILMPGGGGGIDLDVITAAAGDILSGKVIVGPDGEPLTGTLALSGDAAAGNVLTGKTFYSNNPKSKLTGTMPNQGAKTAALNCGGSYTIPAGYHNGSGKITANSLASQTSATASAGDILTGKTAWVNGSKRTGTIKDYSSSIQTATTSTSDQTKSCYRSNGDNIEIVPAVGYWGKWDWSQSCIRVPFSAQKAGNGYVSDHTVESSILTATQNITTGLLVCFSARNHTSLYDTSVSASSSNCRLTLIGEYTETGNNTSSIMKIYKVQNLASGKTISMQHVGTSVQYALIKLN